MVLTNRLFIECRHVYILTDTKHSLSKLNETSSRSINCRRVAEWSPNCEKKVTIGEIQKRHLPWRDLNGFIAKKIWC